MKLIKILDNFNTPIKEEVISIFPKDLDKILDSKYVLISDSKFRLLELAGVKMHTFKEFIDSEIYSIEGIDTETYYPVKSLIQPKVFDPYTINLNNFNIGDIIFVYNDLEKIADEQELEIPYYGFICMVTNIKEIPNSNLKTIDGKKILVIGDVKSKTTKDSEQFGIDGKMSNDSKTIVSKTIGGIKAGTSIKNKSLKDVLIKLFGLKKEEEFVGSLINKEIKKDEEDNNEDIKS